MSNDTEPRRTTKAAIESVAEPLDIEEPDAEVTPLRVVSATEAAARAIPSISSAHLHEDTMRAGNCLVTLSTFYDGTARATRSVLIAHTEDPDDQGEPRVLVSFELDAVPGAPDEQATRDLHLWNANRVAHLLAGDATEQIEHGDLIRSVLESASYFAPDRYLAATTSAPALP